MAYKGKFPNRIKSVSYSKTNGLVIVSLAGEVLRLSNEQIKEKDLLSMPKCGDDISHFRTAPPLIVTKELLKRVTIEAGELQADTFEAMCRCKEIIAKRYGFRTFAAMREMGRRMSASSGKD